MNTTDPGPAAGTDPHGAHEPRRARTVAEMRRSSDDRLIAGVCSGAGRHLGIDPIIIRVVLAVLCLAGLAGLIIYLAAWLLIPADDAPRSIVADWFDLGASERQVRNTGLLIAGIVALMAVVGDTGLGFLYWPVIVVAVWVGIPLAAAYWFFVVRPRRARTTAPPAPGTATMSAEPGAAQGTAWTTPSEETADGAAAGPVPPADHRPPAPPPAPPPPRQRRPFSWALTVLTFSVIAISLAAVYLAGADLRWTAYIVIALGITAAALVLGTVVGNAGPLIPVGVLLVAALAVGVLVPSLRAGDVRFEPATVAEVESDYTVGMGRLTLDLTRVDDPSQLEGRTITLKHGLGETMVIIPDGLEVALNADVLAGGVDFLDTIHNGTGIDVKERSVPDGPVLTLDADQSMGQVTVMRR
ncbi:PspC domain-containing protein [Aeromicrobium sp. CTD01-1L150]|uniref:PspC domain-containing protein n=1 Tax=Aeromicrobium sp. CTD01-1L150 TaxID=3341830 RepID=UPI0035C13904